MLVRRMPSLSRQAAARPPLAPHAGRLHRERGFMLVEALVAILVFSLGILGVVGMQARSVQMMSDATYRAQAAQHASELIAEMWTVDPSRLAALYSSGGNPVGTRYTEWKNRIVSGSTALPGASANLPTVTITTTQTAYSTDISFGSQTATTVSVTVRWKAPSSDVVGSYTTTAMILEPQS
jgi:type IV pilus assembly protein PilV